MSICHTCGIESDHFGPEEVCAHHLIGNGTWSACNRIWCNYFHRGEPIPRLPEKERGEEEWIG